MAQFLTTSGTVSQIEDILKQAKREVTFITPYVKISPLLLDRLKDADNRGIRIRLVYGKREIDAEESAKLRQLKHLVPYFLDHLHAKCYLNESCALITSLNMYEFSERKNREMAVLLSATDDAAAFADTVAEVESIIRAAELRPQAPAAPPAPRGDGKRKKGGFCIRCADGLVYQPPSPLCGDCYGSWAAWGNEEYVEKFCHRCGKSHATSKARPLCYACFREEPFAAPAARGFR